MLKKTEAKPFSVILTIPADRIANMMISFVESGDPVTHASKGGWCAGISLKFHTFPLWYASPETWSNDFTVAVDEVGDGKIKTHFIRRADLVRGLAILAEKYPDHFAMILRDDTDAPCADLFVQCVLFGEEKYA